MLEWGIKYPPNCYKSSIINHLKFMFLTLIHDEYSNGDDDETITVPVFDDEN